MSDKEIVAFKNSLRNYDFYKDKIKELNEELELIYYNLTGVKGISFDRQPGTTSPQAKSDKLYDTYEKIDKIKAKIDRYTNEIKYIDKVLDQLEDDVKSLVIGLYIKHKTYRRMAREICLSTSAMQYEVNKALKGVQI